LFAIIVSFSDGIHNNHVIANCPQNVPVNRSITGEDMEKSYRWHVFLWPTVYNDISRTEAWAIIMLRTFQRFILDSAVLQII